MAAELNLKIQTVVVNEARRIFEVSDFENRYGVIDIMGHRIFDLEQLIICRQHDSVKDINNSFCSSISLNIPILDFIGQHTDSILQRGREKYDSLKIKNALLNTNLNFQTVTFPVINRRFT